MVPYSSILDQPPLLSPLHFFPKLEQSPSLASITKPNQLSVPSNSIPSPTSPSKFSEMFSSITPCPSQTTPQFYIAPISMPSSVLTSSNSSKPFLSIGKMEESHRKILSCQPTSSIKFPATISSKMLHQNSFPQNSNHQFNPINPRRHVNSEPQKFGSMSAECTISNSRPIVCI